MMTGVTVNADSYSDLFDSLWARVERRFFKLEMAPSYSGVIEESYRAWKAGDILKAERAFEESLHDELPLLMAIPRQRMSYIRMRVVDPPLADYVKWELLTYRVSARYGQQIFVHSVTPRSRERLRGLSDFMLFDDFAAVSLWYDDGGNRIEIRLHEDPKEITALETVADLLLDDCELLGTAALRLIG